MLKPKKSAFSLLELSIVILIIGILLIGVIGSKHLIKKTRLASAQSLTTNSPINGILGNALWLESSLDYKAFSNNSNPLTNSDSGNALRDEENIDNWNDNSYNQNKPSIVKVGNGPTYANTINNIQAVKFSGSDTDYLEITDASFLNGTDYTIFILEKRLGDEDNNYFIGDSSVTADNETLILGYSEDSSPIHSQGSSNNYTASVEGYASYSNKPRLFTFVSDSVDGKKMYINGVLAKEYNNTDKLSNITSLPIGKGYNGEIGEIVIFTRALKNIERKDVENYISKKWKAPNNRDVIADCTTGTVTSTGCDESCAVSVVGSSDVTPRVKDSTGEIECNQTGYDIDDIIAYTCTDGIAITGTCACADGYILFGGECIIDTTCPIGTINGITQTGSVTDGSGTLTCDDTNFDGGTINYTCSDNTLTPSGTCNCSAGYSDFDSNGTCELKCEITGELGVVDGTLVDSGSTSINCNDPNATGGTIAYTCNNGSLGAVVNECEIPICTSDTDAINPPVISGVTLHIFNTTGSHTLTCIQPVTARILVVAGGGGGAGRGGNKYGGSGGGGGGLIHNSSYEISVGSHNITVGNRGFSSANLSGSNGGNGENSSFDDLIAIGGGGGGYANNNGNNGGSGGAPGVGNSSWVGGSGTADQGFAGGNNAGNSWQLCSGGAGGAGGAGSPASGAGGTGGPGLQINITGTSVYYSGGGGGSCSNNLNNNPGPAGGGPGSGSGSYGGGGSSVGGNAGSAGDGGLGIVIVRYTNP